MNTWGQTFAILAAHPWPNTSPKICLLNIPNTCECHDSMQR